MSCKVWLAQIIPWFPQLNSFRISVKFQPIASSLHPVRLNNKAKLKNRPNSIICKEIIKVEQEILVQFWVWGQPHKVKPLKTIWRKRKTLGSLVAAELVSRPAKAWNSLAGIQWRRLFLIIIRVMMRHNLPLVKHSMWCQTKCLSMLSTKRVINQIVVYTIKLVVNNWKHASYKTNKNSQKFEPGVAGTANYAQSINNNLPCQIPITHLIRTKW